MTIPWQKMTVEEFARFQRALGEPVIIAEGIFWLQVRPFFYRPLLPYQEYPPQSVSGPFPAFFGGAQHAVPAQGRTNSFMNLLVFGDPTSYSPSLLEKDQRREIRRAAEVFTVSLVTDANEFKVRAYPVYRSFYERTKYGYKPGRRYEHIFSKWAEAVFQHPKVILLGAYKKNRELGAVGGWCLVEDTLVAWTFFCETASLKLHVTSLMLHTMREAAAGCQAIKLIYIGNYKYSAAAGIDDFYLARGCKLVRKPAWLQLNPLAAFGLKRFAPEQYGRLIGEIKDLPGGTDFVPGTPVGEAGTGATSREARAVELGGTIPPAARG